MNRKFLITIIVIMLSAFALSSCATSSPYSKEQKQQIINEATTLVDQKGDWRKTITLYKQLTEFEKVNSPARQKTLRYLLDTNLALVNEEKGKEALEFAFELDKIIPNDFYVQNRILGAYRVLAEDEIRKKNWQGAYDILYNTALRIRFDQEVMRTYLKLRMFMAEEAISKKQTDVARAFLDEIIMIANIDDNKYLFAKEKEDAKKLFDKMARP